MRIPDKGQAAARRRSDRERGRGLSRRTRPPRQCAKGPIPADRTSGTSCRRDRGPCRKDAPGRRLCHVRVPFQTAPGGSRRRGILHNAAGRRVPTGQPGLSPPGAAPMHGCVLIGSTDPPRRRHEPTEKGGPAASSRTARTESGTGRSASGHDGYAHRPGRISPMRLWSDQREAPTRTPRGSPDAPAAGFEVM